MDAEAQRITRKDTLARVLVGAVSIVCLGPLSGMAGIYLVFLMTLYSTGDVGREAVIGWQPLVFLACCLVLVTAWWVVGVFVIRGRVGLARMGRLPLAITTFGVVATVVAGAAVALRFAGFKVFPEPGLFVFGLPALVPFAIVAGQWRRARIEGSA